MASDQTPPIILNGPVDLTQLRNLNLNGVSLVFVGPFDIRDLQNVNLSGSTVVIHPSPTAPASTSNASPALAPASGQLQTSTVAVQAAPLLPRPSEPTPDPRLKRRRELGSSSAPGTPPAPSAAPDTVTEPSRDPRKRVRFAMHPARALQLREPSPVAEPESPKSFRRTKSNATALGCNRLGEKGPKK